MTRAGSSGAPQPDIDGKGMRIGIIAVALLVLVALGSVACVRLVGALLTTALFVIPAATGVLLSDILIETSGGSDPIRCSGHSKGDATRMKALIERYQNEHFRVAPGSHPG